MSVKAAPADAESHSLLEINAETVGARLDENYVGTYHEVVPVPKAGKIKFSDIGKLSRLYDTVQPKNIDLTDQLFQQMISARNKKPIDPKNYRGAIWGQGFKVDFTDNQPPPPVDGWFCAFLNDFPGNQSSVSYDGVTDSLMLVADVRDEYQANWGKYNETAAINYVGRFPAGTRLKASVTMMSRNQDRYGTAIEANIRGWKDGWFGGDQSYHNYQRFTKNSRNTSFETFSAEFTVLGGWEDIWVTCEVLSNDPRYADGYKKNIGYYKNYRISLA